jgi:AraC-like DNA-binding protein
MQMSQQLLFFFSALGAFNGLLLAGYLLLFLKPSRLSNRLLGLLLLALSIRIGKSVFLYFNAETARLYLQIGLTACFFIGPLLLAYVKARRDNLEKVPTSWWVIFVALATFIIGYGVYRPYTDYPDFWRNGFVEAIYGVWSVGILVAGWVLWPVIRKKGKWLPIEAWTVNVFIGNLIVHLAYRYGSIGSYIVGALSFSFVFYLLVLWYILQRREKDFLVTEKARYTDRKIDAKDAEALLNRCDEMMATQQLFLDPDFKLNNLAEAVGSTSHQVSQVLNDNLGKSFSAYLKPFRIRHAQQAILTDDHLTLEAIGMEAGFGSKSAFYTAFKEVAGTTPAQYRKEP